MKAYKSSYEKGQSLVIVVLGFLAFIGILAVVLDGGNAYAAKRQAQNAADAGAIAGATIMCKNHSEEQGEAAAQTYALNNGADPNPIVDASLSNATVTVAVTVTKDTFFAGVIGFPHVSPVADAQAACRNPGAGVLPIAWSCRAPVEGGLLLPGEDCTQEINPNPETDPYNLDYTYIAMDSVKVNNSKKGGHCDPEITNPLDPNYCYEQSDVVCAATEPPDCESSPLSNEIDCDIDNDCVDELMTGGARAWLDLDGSGGGAADLKGWIAHPETVPEINVHDWLPSAQGTDTSIFREAIALVGKDVVLPVFSNLCKTGVPNILSDQLDPESIENCTYTDYDNLSLAGSNVNYHIYSFSAFHVTCVQTGKNKNNQVFPEPGYIFTDENTEEWCNGHYAAVNNETFCDPNPPHKCTGSIDENDKTIEGYFIELDLGGYGGPGGWNDTGTFTVVLTK